MTENTMLPFERPVQVDIEEEMKRSYLDYAMSVIIGRALPDVRDGLKPVHRRVLYGMCEAGNTSTKPYKKSARIVGDVMGKYHPHGDSAIYDTVVRMAQDFSLRYPLVDGQGNFGSIDGDNAGGDALHRGPADQARRGDVEGRHRQGDRRLGAELRRHREGAARSCPPRSRTCSSTAASGIAVGMATNIPPHNLGEVCDALVMLIDDPETPLDKLMQAIPGPDFPTAGFIHGLDRHPHRLRDRPRHHPDARPRRRRDHQARRRAPGDHRHRDPLPGEQGAADREDRRAGAREADRGDLGPARRVRPRRHAHRHRGEARRSARGHPEPALQADPDAVDLRHHLPRHRRQPAEGPDARRDAAALPRTTGRP